MRDRDRSFPLAALELLARVPGVHLINLPFAEAAVLGGGAVHHAQETMADRRQILCPERCSIHILRDKA